MLLAAHCQCVQEIRQGLSLVVTYLFTVVGVAVVVTARMATVSLAFRWLDMLEKEFDKAFVDLDLLLGEIDPDQCELTYDGRQKMTALSAAFAQLSHKAQTIFQSNAKLEVGFILFCSSVMATYQLLVQ